MDELPADRFSHELRELLYLAFIAPVEYLLDRLVPYAERFNHWAETAYGGAPAKVITVLGWPTERLLRWLLR